MTNSNKYRLLKISLMITAVAALVACGGANNSQSVDLSESYTPKPSSTEFPLYSAEGLSNGLTKLELTPEQQASATAAFQAFEQKSQTVANVSGFIVKYKNGDTEVLESSSMSSVTAASSKAKTSRLSSSTGSNITAATVVSSLGNVTSKHGVDLTFKSENFAGAAVLNSNKVLTLSKAKEIAEEMKLADSQIESVEPNILMTSTALPTATETTGLWGVKTSSTYGVNAEQAWGVVDGNNVVVAVVDTGYRPHADLAGRFVMNGTSVAGYDFIGDTGVAGDGNGRDSNAIDPGDSCGGGYSSWHGTHVAGTIAAASNGSGIAGVAYGAKILPIRVLGKCGGYLSDVADGIVWAAGGSVAGVPTNPNPAKVINLSLGGSSSTCNPTMQNAIDTARTLGAVVVVAAGNSATDAQYATPANCAAAITVGATDVNGLLAYFSNYGAMVDISAPGVSIKSTINSGGALPGTDNAYANYSGTSMATPHVAGVLALMFSKDPSLTVSLAESKLVLNTRPFSPYFNILKKGGAGIADGFKAVTALTGTSPEPEPTPSPTPPSPKKGVAKPRDFNGDSIGDALWRNLNTGLTKLSLLSATSMSSQNLTLSLLNGNSYVLQASGDFDGDGKKDLILRHTVNGRAVIALMNGANVVSQGSISTVPVNYKAVAAGDFNQDGSEDILWRNTAGLMFISYMDGVKEISRSGTLNISATIKLQGVADYDGDGLDDLLLRAPSGMISALIMSTSGGYWLPLATASSNYQVVGVGDYTGDNVNDILFKNIHTNLVTLFANPTKTSYQLLTSTNGVPAAQVIQKSGDFDGDGKADLLLRNSNTGIVRKANLEIFSGYLTLKLSAPLGTVPLNFAAQ
jgi:serine protease